VRLLDRLGKSGKRSRPGRSCILLYEALFLAVTATLASSITRTSPACAVCRNPFRHSLRRLLRSIMNHIDPACFWTVLRDRSRAGHRRQQRCRPQDALTQNALYIPCLRRHLVASPHNAQAIPQGAVNFPVCVCPAERPASATASLFGVGAALFFTRPVRLKLRRHKTACGKSLESFLEFIFAKSGRSEV
jgi:RNase P protein component